MSKEYEFMIYAGTEHTDEGTWYAEEEYKRHPEIPLGDLLEFFNNNPLYEVEFRVVYNPETKQFDIISADAGWGHVLV